MKHFHLNFAAGYRSDWVGSAASMRNLLRPGDQIVWGKVELRDVRIGDLLIFPRSSRLVLHRAVRPGMSKGDALCYVDKLPLKHVKFLGRVDWVFRGEACVYNRNRNAFLDKVAAKISYLGDRAARIHPGSYRLFRVILMALSLFTRIRAKGGRQFRNAAIASTAPLTSSSL